MPTAKSDVLPRRTHAKAWNNSWQIRQQIRLTKRVQGEDFEEDAQLYHFSRLPSVYITGATTRENIRARMPWRQVSPGRFERSLDPTEYFFWAINAAPKPPKRERWALSAIASFKTNLRPDEIPQALRFAWKVMRHDYPILGATLEKTKKVYVVPSDREVEDWLDQTFVVEPPSANVDSVLASYVPTPLSMFHYFPSSDEVMLHSSHWRADGIGLLHFADHLFDILADPPSQIVFGDEGERLPPSLEEVAGICEITPEKEEKVHEKWRKVIAAAPTLRLPVKAFGPPGGTYRRTYLFTKDTTSAIVAACKKRNLSVTAAIAASLINVVEKFGIVEGGDKPKNFVTQPNVNLRPYLPTAFDPKAHAFTVMIINDPVVIEVKDFESMARQLGSFYSRKDDPTGSNVLSLASTWQQNNVKIFSGQVLPGGGKPVPGAPLIAPQASAPSLNSLGVFDRYLNPMHNKKHNFEVTDFRFAVEVLGAVILMYAWTYRGRLRLNPYYNETFYDASYVQMILDSLRDTLVSNLGITCAPQRANL